MNQQEKQYLENGRETIKGSIFHLTTKTRFYFLIIALILFFLTTIVQGTIFLILINMGKLQSNINQNVTLQPLFNATVTTLNNYESPETNIVNEYDFKPENNFSIIINNQITCPTP